MIMSTATCPSVCHVRLPGILPVLAPHCTQFESGRGRYCAIRSPARLIRRQFASKQVYVVDLAEML
jgi:hypothetical protein